MEGTRWRRNKSLWYLPESLHCRKLQGDEIATAIALIRVNHDRGALAYQCSA
jgi:hypothetical protein